MFTKKRVQPFEPGTVNIFDAVYLTRTGVYIIDIDETLKTAKNVCRVDAHGISWSKTGIDGKFISLDDYLKGDIKWEEK